ncbi:MAG: hypothetical protein S4CHLAM6_11840 [Chlamydiae bacterium]|nr:hypothetical protein [Chlamydiota bacterium]
MKDPIIIIRKRLSKYFFKLIGWYVGPQRAELPSLDYLTKRSQTVKRATTKVISFLLLWMIGIATPLLAQQQFNLKPSHVKEVMDDMFVYHVEQKEMKPEIVKRSFRLYLDRFDVLKYYLTESEISTFYNPSDSMLSDAVNRYYKGDLYYYEQLQALVETAIVRARTNRELMRHEVERNVMSKNNSRASNDGSISFARGQPDLVNRQKQHMQRFITMQDRSTPFVATSQDYQKMFEYYESRMREYESNYYPDSNQNAKQQSDHNLAFHTLKSLTRSLDTHTEYFSPGETRMMQSSLSKGFYGVGLVLQRDYRGITVYEITKNGPAEKSGDIAVGDEVISINNKEIKDLKYKEIIELLHGGENEKLQISVRTADSQGNLKEKSVVVFREKVGLTTRLIEVDYEPFQDGIIGRITLNSFYDNQAGVSSSKDMKKAIESLKAQGDLKGLIFDIRQNTGGYFLQAIEVAGLFMSNGVVAAAKFSDGKLHYLRDLEGKKAYGGPLVILTSRLSASSSEIVAGTLSDYGIAVIVGDPQTFGKGSVQYQTLTLPNPKHYFKVTIGRYYTVSGKCTQLDGVKADIVLPSEYYYEKIGEQFVTAPLSRDSIEPAYEDKLADLDARAKDIFTRFYLPTLQKRVDTWKAMVPDLKKNSAKRLAKNKEFQAYLKNLENGQHDSRSSQKDVQLEEATNILKDMVEMNQSKSHSKLNVFSR